MRYDIYCKVIDNYGDVGVCWRLAAGLARAGEVVHLWIDDPEALTWMAPGGCEGVTVFAWNPSNIAQNQSLHSVPDVLIEAFGCTPPDEAIAKFAEAARTGKACRHWINLEYLSAEATVERLHGLPSPVYSGPGAGLTKHFFYPGFTERTGGLLREDGLTERRARFDRAPWLEQQGIPWQGERLVALFCYEPPALEGLLHDIAAQAVPTRLLVTAGRTANTVAGWPVQRGALSISRLPHLSQDDFDRLLWSCDLNFVRGEDSLVRALWAEAPLVWQIYPQDDDAHHAKLAAFLDWMDAPASMRKFHTYWNAGVAARQPVPDGAALAAWQIAVSTARTRLLRQDDLVNRLRGFVAQKS
ncbi:MAG: elongation factor P maturation arginine rhamnosyltransferase EarP [Gammaproteobacteria bacterium]|nr:elongation factor P maturation arginine rhamnosyltransferase EarP [Gammaproteobacteria bacterium]MBU1442560.1 elongation factor P maturation arginine rhamnosyltransferase EarP [Gammaproteobacteria bacterium]MBU2284820.1 elongation factor P maturation arginine rhamnosyltransferase EarP [Gammaproteobacteria bacterium]MBU2407256.1 elongation factor P maturation arginine rhamnosyltransferase EarP [Gammaproteobacteria bacterium]